MFGQLALVLCLIAVAICFASDCTTKPTRLIGGEHCTWGPSYWCANIKNAHQCNASKYCISKEWMKLNFHEDQGSGDNICSACQVAVGKMKEENSLNPFEDFCRNAIEDEDQQQECLFLRMGYNDILFEFITSDLDAHVICYLVTMCGK